MVTCTDCQDLLWDYEYGLLDAAEQQVVRSHLADCPACQGELEQVQSGRQHLRAAAVLDVVIPPFEPPADEPRTLPLPVSRAGRPVGRPHFRRWLAVAAAVAFVVGLPYGLYHRGLSEYTAPYARAEQRLHEIETGRQEIRQQIQLVVAEAGPVHLQVFGPTRFQLGAGYPLRVLTTDADDRPLAAQVTVRLSDSDGGVLVERKGLPSNGNLPLELSGDVAGEELSAVHLEVVAEASLGRVRVRKPVPVSPPSYLTHVSFAKPVYRPGEKVLFRTVTLDAVRLQPPARPFRVTYLVEGPGGKRVWPPRDEQRLTLEGGIGGGEFDLLPAYAYPDGDYTLTITEADSRFAPVTHRFLVRRDQLTRLRKTVAFDRPSYKAGESVTARLRVEGIDKGTAVAGLPVSAKLEVDRKLVGDPKQLRTNADGTASITFPLPAEIRTGAVFLRLAVDEESPYIRAIPVAVARRSVEFFPEGGELLAGVPNRVYFRVRTPAGQPVDFAGRVVDGQGQEVAVLATVPGPGLGEFTFTPRAGATYTARSDDPALTIEKPALPPVRTVGVALSVPAGAVGAREPVRALLRNPGAERPVVVGVFCRGRLVAHQHASLPTGSSDVVLTPPEEVAGVLRVTVFDPEAQPPRPVAERLVYRQPAKGLRLTVKADKEAYRPGEHVRLEIQSRTEGGAAEPAWLLAAVVNEDALLLDDRRERNLPAHFYVLNEVRRPEDLERADLFAPETPAARKAVDLFLGTQGWRRFLTRALPADADGGILRLDSYDRNGPAGQRTTREALAARDARLAEEQDEAADAFRAAAAGLTGFDERARVGLSAAGLATFAVGCVVLLAGLRRVVRGRLTARPYFAGAFASLLVCLLSLFGLRATGGHDVEQPSIPNLSPVPAGYALLPELAPVLETADVPQERLLARANLRWSEQVARVTRVVHPAGSPESVKRDGPRLAVVRTNSQSIAAAEGLLDLRVYAYDWPRSGEQDVVLWHPILHAEDGSAQVEFDVPAHGSRFRILVHGHSNAGRLGTVESTLAVQP
jgi:anti-sigma factor RsiW